PDPLPKGERETSGRHGIRTHTTLRPHGVANRPGQPYPATFRMLVGRIGNPSYECPVDPPGIEPGFPVCRTGFFPLDHEPGAECGVRNSECHSERSEESCRQLRETLRFAQGDRHSAFRIPHSAFE